MGLTFDHPQKFETNLIWDIDSGVFRPMFSSDLSQNQNSRGTVSSSVALTGSLTNGEFWTGEAIDVSRYSSVVFAAKTDKDCRAYLEFSPDNVNWDSSLLFQIQSGINEVHRLSVTRKYFRAKVENTGNSNQSYFRSQILFGEQPHLTSSLNSSIQSDADAVLTRGIILGETDGGQFKTIPVTPEGHLEVAIHGPRNPFGSVHAEKLYPIFQADGVYGVNQQLVSVTTGLGGEILSENSQFILKTNTGVGGNATLQSRKRLRYRPGQGAVARFTALFNTGVANSFQVAGIGHPEDGLYFGYSGVNFGILHSRGGVREHQFLNLTAAASVAANVSVTLNGVNFSTPVTNSANLARTAYDISTGTYVGWSCEPTDSGVYFIANSIGNKAGTFLLTGVEAATTGTFSKIRTGEALTEDWILQDNWNVESLKGTGATSFNLNPQKGNVYEIAFQYLGYGAIDFKLETQVGNNNPNFTTVHSINYQNRNVLPSFRNPAFPFTASAYSYGSTTNMELKTASFAGFIEGEKVLNGPAFSFTETSTAVAASAWKALFTVKNSYIFQGKTNQTVINILNVNGAAKANQPTTFVLIKNGALTGNPVFNRYSTNSSCLYDNSATNVIFNENEQEIFSFSLGDAGQQSFNLEDFGILLQPGESITVAARTAAATASYVSASLNVREDQ